MARSFRVLLILTAFVVPASAQLDVPVLPDGQIAPQQVEPEVLTRGPAPFPKKGYWDRTNHPSDPANNRNTS